MNMIGIGIFFTIIVAGIWLFVHTPQFGKNASGERLERIRQSPNWDGKQFVNQSPTPALAEDTNMGSVMLEFFFNSNKKRKPSELVPSKKENLKSIPLDADVFVWLGHGSYYFQTGGKRFLVDPVLNGSASPIQFTTRSFKGSDVYTSDDIPDVDYLLITHDHWDHLDYSTLKQLQPRIGKIITGLGVGEHLEHWGFAPHQIFEGDWGDSFSPEPGLTVTLTPARHFSGRLFKRNQTLWVSFVVKIAGKSLFLSGDGGYDHHFAEIGKQYGPFDYAILECGQYNESWRYIHMLPPQVLQAAKDLNANCFIPVHWGKFQLANHDWDEPINVITALADKQHFPLIHPVIGAVNEMNDQLVLNASEVAVNY